MSVLSPGDAQAETCRIKNYSKGLNYVFGTRKDPSGLIQTMRGIQQRCGEVYGNRWVRQVLLLVWLEGSPRIPKTVLTLA